MTMKPLLGGMKAKHLAAGLMLAALAGAAHAEGNHDFGNLGRVLLFAATTALVLFGVWIYVLLLPRIDAASKFFFVLMLTVIDAFACIMAFEAFDTGTLNPDLPFGYILVLIPGACFAYMIGKASKKKLISA